MFTILKPSEFVIERFLSRQQSLALSYPDVGATRGTLPGGYTVDRNRVRLGQGAQVFYRAVTSLRGWQMFKFGWVQLFRPGTPIESGMTVAVLAHHFGFWSLNGCRVVYVFEEARRYGFAYGTLQDHAEQGEERFSVEWLPDDSVCYDILAFSRPVQWQARIARPLSRMLQRKFARDSMTAMQQAICADTPL